MTHRTTISDIAKELNITPATVSRALSDHPGISLKTKELVHKTASRLHYKRNKIASSLRSGRSYLIGVIIPSAQINFFGSVVHGIENLASLHNYNVLIYQSNEDYAYEVKAIETFISARVDGILVSIAKNTFNYEHFIEAKKRGVPIIFFDRANDNLGISSVVVNDYKGGFLATQHLIQQGYTRIAHVSGPQHLKVFYDRLKGYTEALQTYHMPIEEDLIVEGNVSIESGKEAINKLLNSHHPPNAVFAVEDFTALGAIKELKGKNIKIPEEFGVVGFANETFGEHITPSLSTFDQQTVEMGKESLRLLLDIIEKPELHHRVSKIILDPIPIFRESSKRLK